MSVYQPLADFLSSRKDDRWDASFTDIVKVLDRALPGSAYKHQAWWANQDGQGRSQASGWRSVGWRTTKLDLERRRVTFERERAGPDSSADLMAQASRLTGIADGDLLIAEALRALIAREATRALASLGGSMTDYRAPDRERP